MKHCSLAFGVCFLLGAFPSCAAKQVCYTTAHYDYYCDVGYDCCQDNTRCCGMGTSSGSSGASRNSNPALIAAAVIGGISGLVFLVAVCVNVRYCMKKRKTTVQPYREQENNTVSTAQQPQNQRYNASTFQSSRTNPPPQIGSPPGCVE